MFGRAAIALGIGPHSSLTEMPRNLKVGLLPLLICFHC